MSDTLLAGLQRDMTRRWSFREEIVRPPWIVIVLRITLLMMTIHGATDSFVDLPLRALCAAMVFPRSLLLDRRLWVLVAAMRVTGNALSWHALDNHKYLMTYWTIACCLALWSADPKAALRHNARILLGLVFFFATLQKAIGGDFLNGAYFETMLLTDYRAQLGGALIGGVSLSTLMKNREIVGALLTYPDLGAAAQLGSSAALRGFALGLSYATLIGEGAAALLFLFGRGRVAQRLRDLFIIGFAGTIYFFLPVIRFGFILLLLGYVQCPLRHRRIRAIFLALMILVHAYVLPITTWLERLIGL